MSNRTSPWPNGVPCWADVMATDVRASGTFYTAVLGWKVPEPEEQWGGYVTAEADGQMVGGIGLVQQGARAAWTLYLATDDAEGVGARAAEHGGSVLAPVMDVGPLGRMAILVDPSGAVFGLWQAGTMIGAGLVNEPGGLVWEDLRSTDPDAARSFCSALFGYEYEALDMAGPDYTTFRLPDEPHPLGGVGGLMGLPDGTSSSWLVYFAVADVDAAVAAAAQAGGTVVAPPLDTPFGPMACLADPDGATFMVMAVDPAQPAPDRSG
jgi:predicted enzyme related to lactoylglutathione lyase